MRITYLTALDLDKLGDQKGVNATHWKKELR